MLKINADCSHYAICLEFCKEELDCPGCGNYLLTSLGPCMPAY